MHELIYGCRVPLDASCRASAGLAVVVMFLEEHEEGFLCRVYWRSVTISLKILAMITSSSCCKGVVIIVA